MKRFVAIMGAFVAGATGPAHAQATQPPLVGLTTLAQTGQTVPGQAYAYGGLAGEDPLGAGRSAPSINNAGHVAAVASFGSAAPAALTLFRGSTDVVPIATAGTMSTAGAPFGTEFGNVALSEHRVGFIHDLDGNLARSVFEGAAGSDLDLLGRFGSPVPGMPQGVFWNEPTTYRGVFPWAAFGRDGTSALVAGVQKHAPRPVLPEHLAGAVLATTPAGGLRPIVFGGDPVPGSATGEVFAFGGPSSSAIGTVAPAVNDSGTVLFYVERLEPGGSLGRGSIWTATADPAGDGWALSHVATSDRDGVGGLSYKSQQTAPSINSHGDVLFHDLRNVYAWGDGTRSVLVGDGQRISDAQERYLRSVSSAILADNGHVAVLGSVGGPNEPVGRPAALAGPPGALRVVAESGAPLGPGVDAVFGDIGAMPASSATEKLAVNALGQVAFPARVYVPDSSGHPIDAYHVLLATDPTGARHTVLRTGGTYAGPDGSKVIKYFNLLLGSNNHDGRPSSFNDLGQLAIHLTFKDNTEAVVVATLPSAIPGDADNDLVVSFADFQRLEAGFGRAGDRTTGDFNYDGLVDHADFMVLYDHFGQSFDGPPLPVSAGDRASLDAFARGHDVPEPGGAVVLLTLAAGAGRRRRRR